MNMGLCDSMPFKSRQDRHNTLKQNKCFTSYATRPESNKPPKIKIFSLTKYLVLGIKNKCVESPEIL
jgi:hypothetical protein